MCLSSAQHPKEPFYNGRQWATIILPSCLSTSFVRNICWLTNGNTQGKHLMRSTNWSLMWSWSWKHAPWSKWAHCIALPYNFFPTSLQFRLSVSDSVSQLWKRQSPEQKVSNITCTLHLHLSEKREPQDENGGCGVSRIEDMVLSALQLASSVPVGFHATFHTLSRWPAKHPKSEITAYHQPIRCISCYLTLQSSQWGQHTAMGHFTVSVYFRILLNDVIKKLQILLDQAELSNHF